MLNEAELRSKLRKIEALYAGAGTKGEKNAAAAALNRIKNKLNEVKIQQAFDAYNNPVEYKFSLNNQWSRKLFTALCRRYKLTPYRRYRQRYTTVMVMVSKNFVDRVLWPQFQAIDAVLEEYLSTSAEKIIKEEVHKDTTEAQEVNEILEIAG